MATTDNRAQLNGVTYDAITAERMLGITPSQLSTLINKGVLTPCNQKAPGATKFSRRFTIEAIELARGKMADVLQPAKARHRSTDADLLVTIDQRLANIEGMLKKLSKDLTGSGG